MNEAADKRSVSTDALETLGTLIGDGCGRDAIHLAVEPVEAAEVLHPGQNIGLVDGKATAYAPKKLGIVDPFLQLPVYPGQRFWLVVYPRQITSLRHVWTHPDFPEAGAVKAADVKVSASKSASEVWMRRWAIVHVSEDYYGDRGRVSEDEAFAFAIQAGENNHIGPYESARDYIDNEWWSHWEIITGKVSNRDEYFSCSC